MPTAFKSVLFSFVLLALFASTYAEEHIAINIGTSPKTGVGLSYDWGKNSLNAGILGIGYSNSGGRLIQPGITYSRIFTDDGWYWTLGYSLFYKNRPDIEVSTSSPGFDDWEHQYNQGWQSGEILIGMGQRFQWESFGLNIDGGVAFSTDSEFFRPVGLRLGLGGSYRFNLD
jgi:hypothetical protein